MRVCPRKMTSVDYFSTVMLRDHLRRKTLAVLMEKAYEDRERLGDRCLSQLRSVASAPTVAALEVFVILLGVAYVPTFRAHVGHWCHHGGFDPFVRHLREQLFVLYRGDTHARPPPRQRKRRRRQREEDDEDVEVVTQSGSVSEESLIKKAEAQAERNDNTYDLSLLVYRGPCHFASHMLVWYNQHVS